MKSEVSRIVEASLARPNRKWEDTTLVLGGVMAEVTFTLIRHGESTDNLKSVWAGWQDAPLSNHGMTQAKAVAAAFAKAGTRFTAIHCSDSKRALWTADAICDTQPESPLVIPSQLLREQHFGEGEGKSFLSKRQSGLSLDEHIEKGIYPSTHHRHEKFPGGESIDDVAKRAEQALDDILLPYVYQAASNDKVDVAIVSHGIFIRELIAALARRDNNPPSYSAPYGLRNTGWVRVAIQRPDVPDPTKETPLCVRVLVVNNYDHLLSVKRQKGGIGRLAYNPDQKNIRSFFSGGT